MPTREWRYFDSTSLLCITVDDFICSSFARNNLTRHYTSLWCIALSQLFCLPAATMYLFSVNQTFQIYVTAAEPIYI